MSGSTGFLNKDFPRGSVYTSCITTTVFTVLFGIAALGILATYVVQTYITNIYIIDIPFVWIGYEYDALLGDWILTYQRYCTNLLLVYTVVFLIGVALTIFLVFMYLTYIRPKDSGTEESFWFKIIQNNYNVYFRFYWILFYPVQICLVLVLFGITDVQYLLASLFIGMISISLYCLADWRLSRPIKDSGVPICLEFNCCTMSNAKEGNKFLPFWTLIEFWIYFIFALIYVALLLVLCLVYTLTNAQYNFYYLWAIFVFELFQVGADAFLLCAKPLLKGFFSKENFKLSFDLALFFINSVVFLLNTLVLLIVSWFNIAYIGCGSGCATSCP